MSGGVDSSVTVALLTDPAITSHLDLDVSAVFMRNWSPLHNEVDHHSFETDCEWEKDWEDVKEVCKARGVKAELVSMLLRLSCPCLSRLLTLPRFVFSPDRPLQRVLVTSLRTLDQRMAIRPNAQSRRVLQQGNQVRRAYEPCLGIAFDVIYLGRRKEVLGDRPLCASGMDGGWEDEVDAVGGWDKGPDVLFEQRFGSSIIPRE
jgi:hypothetical protein